MKRLILILVVIIGLMLMITSCSEDKPTEPGISNFSLRIKLTDSSGMPLEGYRVSISPRDLRFGATEKLLSKTRAQTTFGFSVAEDYYVNLTIYDYFGRETRNLVNHLLSAGNHSVVWDGKDCAGKQARDGIYKAVIEYYGSPEPERDLVFTEKRFAYLLAEIDPSISPHRTDENGIVTDRNILPFPVLYCKETIPRHDEHGEYLGDIVFCDIMRVVVFDGEDTYKFHDFRIINGRNSITLNWDEMEERGNRSTNNKNRTVQGTVFINDDDPDGGRIFRTTRNAVSGDISDVRASIARNSAVREAYNVIPTASTRVLRGKDSFGRTYLAGKYRGDAESTPIREAATEANPGFNQFTLSVRVEGRGTTAPLEAGRDYIFAAGQEITATTATPDLAYEFVEWGSYASDDLDTRLATWYEPRLQDVLMPPFDITAIAYFSLIDDTHEEELDEPNDGDNYRFTRATFKRGAGTDDETLRYIYSTNWRILTHLGNPQALAEYYYFGTDDNAWFRQGTVSMRFNRRPHEVWWRPVYGRWHQLNLEELGDWWDESVGTATFTVSELPGTEVRFDGGGEFATPQEGQTPSVVISSFTASVTAQMFVQLQWVTETETNMLGYRIHRATENSLAQAVIISREIIPARNSSEMTEYVFTDEEVEPGMTYYYWLETIDLDLTNNFHGPVTIILDGETVDPPPENRLYQNYPNPFN